MQFKINGYQTSGQPEDAPQMTWEALFLPSRTWPHMSEFTLRDRMIQLQDSRKHLLQQDQPLWLDIPWPPSLSLDRALQGQDPSARALLRCTPAKAPFPSTASTQGPQVLSHVSAKALCSNSPLCMFAHEPPCHGTCMVPCSPASTWQTRYPIPDDSTQIM